MTDKCFSRIENLCTFCSNGKLNAVIGFRKSEDLILGYSFFLKYNFKEVSFKDIRYDGGDSLKTICLLSL